MVATGTISTFSFYFERLLVKKQPMDKQMAPVAATSSRANVVLSPVSASSAESLRPRKFTELSFSGALVAEKNKF